MSVEYLGKVNNIVTVEKLKELTGMSIGTYATGDITFLEFNVDGKQILVASRFAGYNMSWDYINSLGYVFGKNVVLNGIEYKCRLLTGGTGNNSIADESEWKKFIVDLTPNDSDSGWSYAPTFCQDSFYSDPSSCITRGGTSLTFAKAISKSISNTSAWRPVLERVENFSVVGLNNDLGHMSSFNKFNYSITNLNGGNFNLTEKVDGQVIRNLNNQSNGEFTFNIENFDSLAYGKHTIEIIADDPTSAGNVTVTSKFNKIKSPVQPIPTDSNLKQVMLHNKELEKEISYQNFRLSEKLKGKGIEVDGSESLSKLIDKAGESKFPSWMNKGDFFINATPRPIKRGKSIASAIGENIYVIGGNKNTDNYSTCAVDVYNTTENSWVTNEMSGYGINSDQSACTVNEFIYITGRYVLRYDPVLNTYTEKTKMLSPVDLASSCVFDGFIYVIGGFYVSSSTVSDENQRYDPVTDTWTKMSKLPTKRAKLTSSVVDGKIYCIGGIGDNSSIIRANECYDPITDTWTTKSFGIYSAVTKTSESYGENIYIFGGATATSLNTYIYNTVTDSWKSVASIDKYRNFLCSASVNGRMYVIGGDFSTTTGDVSVMNNIYIP